MIARISRYHSVPFLFLMVLCLCALPRTRAAEVDLPTLLKQPDATFRWERVSRAEKEGVAIQDLRMTSQMWHDIAWRHRLQVFRSNGAAHPEFCVLINTGGSGGPGEEAMGMGLAKLSGCTVAILYNVPNQPLFGDKTEDALIAYSWQKYIETKDPTWILNVPMTRSVIRAMDTVQAEAKEAGGTAVTGFMITGASKRGWTSYLAGASGDPRVKAIAPMVFDMLNMPAQVPHQLATLGKPSEQIRDYSATGMLDLINTADGKRLIHIVDPYEYRDRLTMPKLIVLGTNDRYWATDALNLYWDGLKGPKWVLYVPNSGHGLEDFARVSATTSAFARSVASGKSLPRLRWKTRAESGRTALSVTSDVAPAVVRVYRAIAPTQDFRDSKWTPEPVEKYSSGYLATIPAPDSGYAAGFVEAEYRLDGGPVYLSTQISIVPAKQKP